MLKNAIVRTVKQASLILTETNVFSVILKAVQDALHLLITSTTENVKNAPRVIIVTV